MTFREKLEKEKPGVDIAKAIVDNCPSDYGYERYTPRCPMGREQDCADCWDREIPEEKEKENKLMNKTKAMLEEELDQKRAEIEDLKKELENEIKRSEKYKQFEECADDLKALQNSFINSGFSEKQAFMMVLQIIGTSHPKN